VDGLGSPTAPGHGIEAALRRERLIVALGIVGAVALAWLYLWHHAAAMHADGGSMAMPVSPVTIALTFAMWVVMMAGMMLPSAAPTVLLYGAMVRKHAGQGRGLPAVWVFVGGYLLVWAGFSFAAALLQAALDHAGVLSSMMASGSQRLNGALVVAAGVYQLTPVKNLCLSKCRNPVQFFMLHWRPGTAGALRMGIRHGAYCVGCCWALMLLLFAAGVMNLAWVAFIAALALVEKLFRFGVLASRFAGAALIIVGLAMFS
jgi:predicted metal-binding membrane protein